MVYLIPLLFKRGPPPPFDKYFRWLIDCKLSSWGIKPPWLNFSWLPAPSNEGFAANMCEEVRAGCQWQETDQQDSELPQSYWTNQAPHGPWYTFHRKSPNSYSAGCVYVRANSLSRNYSTALNTSLQFHLPKSLQTQSWA